MTAVDTGGNEPQVWVFECPDHPEHGQWDPYWLGNRCRKCDAYGKPPGVVAAVADLRKYEADHPILSRVQGGGSFILDTPPNPVPLWGRDDDVLWAEGESLVIVGPQGTGKSTIAQQIALARANGIGPTELLGYNVEPSGVVLYLAMDRPRQIARSLRRMVGEEQREALDDWLKVWQGPPLFDMAKNTDLLVQMADAAGARTVVVDSIKDAAIGLSDDEVGAGWNRARQKALRAGHELVELHHQRKAVNGAARGRSSIDDVYGSTWITSGAGSVVMLAGEPGDAIVELRHVKQPANEVGPVRLMHDNVTGRSSLWHATDLVSLARSTGGLTALEAAKALFETDKPTSNEKEKARRRLAGLVAAGQLALADPGDKAANRPAVWAVPNLFMGGPK